MVNFLLNFCWLDENFECFNTWISDNWGMTTFLRLHGVIPQDNIFIFTTMRISDFDIHLAV